jgi:hypothetical protein
MSATLVQRLRESVTQCRALDRSALLEEAAAEIERLRSLTRFQDGVIRSGDVACLTQAEREALEVASVWVNPERHATLRGLLERLGGHQ